MTISKKQLEEAIENAFTSGKNLGTAIGIREERERFNASKMNAQKDLIHAASELAQANAKLTYAMSQMLQK